MIGPPIGGLVRISFGEFTLDTESREFFRDGQAVHISPKAFLLLEVLLERRPAAVPKPVLKDRLWPSSHVSEASLASLVAELRSALADDAREPRFIRTVHTYGYAFCGTTDAPPPAAAASGQRDERICRLVWRDREITLADGENLLGRDRQAVVWIDSATVSRRHARIVVTDGEALIEDLGSRNGTSVGGKKIQGPVRLADGDRLRLGAATMTFRIFSSSETLPDAESR
jgi:DNA-binding winged helix-turn-helix (wHTH) protein